MGPGWRSPSHGDLTCGLRGFVVLVGGVSGLGFQLSGAGEEVVAVSGLDLLQDTLEPCGRVCAHTRR